MKPVHQTTNSAEADGPLQSTVGDIRDRLGVLATSARVIRLWGESGDSRVTAHAERIEKQVEEIGRLLDDLTG